MLRSDFLTLIGSRPGQADYIPVALLLKNGYGVAGYFNTPVNEDLQGTCVLVNARMIDLRPSAADGNRALKDFGDFLQEIATRLMREDELQEEANLDASGRFGASVPLTAIPYDEIAVVYPVSRISSLMRRVEEVEDRIPTFLDFENRSEIVKLLKTRLW
jgi:hypothetical protein